MILTFGMICNWVTVLSEYTLRNDHFVTFIIKKEKKYLEKYSNDEFSYEIVNLLIVIISF